jgi:hypothetical protein
VNAIEEWFQAKRDIGCDARVLRRGLDDSATDAKDPQEMTIGLLQRNSDPAFIEDPRTRRRSYFVRLRPIERPDPLYNSGASQIALLAAWLQ